MTRRGFIQAAGAALGALAAWTLGVKEGPDDTVLPIHVKEDLDDLITNLDPAKTPLMDLSRPGPNPFGVRDEYAREAAKALERVNAAMHDYIERDARAWDEFWRQARG